MEESNKTWDRSQEMCQHTQRLSTHVLQLTIALLAFLKTIYWTSLNINTGLPFQSKQTMRKIRRKKQCGLLSPFSSWGLHYWSQGLGKASKPKASPFFSFQEAKKHCRVQSLLSRINQKSLNPAAGAPAWLELPALGWDTSLRNDLQLFPQPLQPT